MNDMELLARLREEVPHGVSPHAEHLFQAALAGDLEAERAGVTRPVQGLVRRGRNGIRAIRPAWRLAITMPLAAGLAAGLLVATRPAGHPALAQTATLTVKLLADQAATAALSGPAVRPGQWVYRKFGKGTGRGVTEVGHATEVWATADDLTQAAYIRGTLLICSQAGTCHPAKIGGQSWGLAWPISGISYAELSSLPSDPRALLSRLERSGSGIACDEADRACHAFQLIGELFLAFLMPPERTAELFRALGYIPGVTVVKDAVDLAGRHGVAFRLPLSPPGPAYEEIILDPRTYQFMSWDGPSADGSQGIAVLAQALVSGPGVRP